MVQIRRKQTLNLEVYGSFMKCAKRGKQRKGKECSKATLLLKYHRCSSDIQYDRIRKGTKESESSYVMFVSGLSLQDWPGHSSQHHMTYSSQHCGRPKQAQLDMR